MSGPISVNAVCFDDSGTALMSVHPSFADADTIVAGGTGSFTVDLFDDPCPNFAVAGSGWSF